MGLYQRQRQLQHKCTKQFGLWGVSEFVCLSGCGCRELVELGSCEIDTIFADGLVIQAAYM